MESTSITSLHEKPAKKRASQPIICLWLNPALQSLCHRSLVTKRRQAHSGECPQTCTEYPNPKNIFDPNRGHKKPCTHSLSIKHKHSCVNVKPASSALFWLLARVFVWFGWYLSSVFSEAWLGNGCLDEFSPSAHCWVWRDCFVC